MKAVTTKLPLVSSAIAILLTFLGAPGSVAAATAPAAALSAPAPAATDSPAQKADAADKEFTIPDQHGLSAEYGYVWDPDRDITFVMARFSAVYDYGTVWHQDRPKSLRYKVEAAVGSTMTPENNLMASANMLALYYPWLRANQTFRPYAEAGIGVIYTQFRVKGQGLHWNFNPLLGIGCELPQQDGKNPFAAIRLHHVSNGGIDDQNRGVNSVELQFGRFF